jgi:hypothetical protein
MGESEEHDSVADVKAVTDGAEEKDGLRRKQSEDVISRGDEDEDDCQQPKLGRKIRPDFEKDGGGDPSGIIPEAGFNLSRP